MSTHPLLIFCPYLPLRESIDFGDWTIGPLASFDDRWADARFETQARAFLAKFMSDSGQPITNPSLLVRRDSQVDGSPLTSAELEALNLSLAFAFMDKNARNTPDAQYGSWAVVTSDNTEVYAWPIDLDGGHVTLTTGVMIRQRSGGYTIADKQLVVRPPLELHMPLGEKSAEADLLDAIYRVVRGAAHSPGANEQADRVRAAIGWFTKAWWNSDRLHMDDRLVFLKTGFEALTGQSKSHLAAAALRTLFESLPNTDAHDAERLLWSPAETPKYPRTYNGKTTLLTDLEHWFMAFGDARNTIIHKGITPPLSHLQPGSSYEGHFVFTAELLLRSAIKATLHNLGYPDLWRSSTWRLSRDVYEFLVKRQAESAGVPLTE